MGKTAAFVPVQQKQWHSVWALFIVVSVKYWLSGKISETLNVADCLSAAAQELKRGFVKAFSQEDARFPNS